MRGYDPIYQLFYGNIRPFERGFRRESAYAKANEEFSQQEAWFNEHLTDEDKERFKKLLSCHDDIGNITAFQNFKYGFQLGVMLVMEVVQMDTSTLYEL